MRLTVNARNLTKLLRDLEETATLNESLNGMRVKINAEGGDFTVNLSRGQVRRLKKTIPVKTIEETYA